MGTILRNTSMRTTLTLRFTYQPDQTPWQPIRVKFTTFPAFSTFFDASTTIEEVLEAKKELYFRLRNNWDNT